MKKNNKDIKDNKDKKNIKDELDYKIIGSGSKGNAVRIMDIMIDCGLPYNKMKEELYKCKVLFITHIHTDHLRMKTYMNIIKYHRNIKIIGNWQVAERVRVDIISNVNPIKTKNWILQPFEVKHNVITQGFTLKTKDKDLIYVTDSAGTENWIKGKYDYLFIESNHDDVKLNSVKKSDYHYDYFNSAKRHTSLQESKAFYYMNRKSKDSKWIELHKSDRFY